jgi:Protein of unknown function (DUF3237)
VPIISGSGFLRSEPSYPIKIDAVFEHGADFIKADADGKHVRLEVQSLVRDKSTGGLIRFNYTGIVSMSGAAGVVLRGEPGAKTTNFGDACEFLQLLGYHTEKKKTERKMKDEAE